MDFRNVKIHIQELFVENAVEIWLLDETTTGTNYISWDGQNLVATLVPQFEAQPPELKPFLRLTLPMYEAFFKAIAEYNSSKGRKTPNENMIEGKLEATQLHLHDMRTIANKTIEKLLKTL